jgi:3-oxoadipate enol-lactonase
MGRKPFLFFCCCAVTAFCAGQVRNAGEVSIDRKAPKGKEGTVAAGKLRVYYIEYGNPKADPLVFIHAGFQDNHMWDRQVAYFSKDHRVICFDQPGQGRTKGSDTTILIADVIRTLLDSLHVKRASFVGLSMGSVCAADIVLTYPERVNKVVFVSPGLTGWKEVISADSLSMGLFRSMDTAFGSAEKTITAARFTDIWCVGPFRNRDSVNKAALDYVYQTTLTCMRDHDIKDLTQFDPKGEANRIGEIQKSVLIVNADADVPMIATMARYMHHQIRNSQAVTIHGAAHMVNMEKPEEFNKILAAFLKQN